MIQTNTDKVQIIISSTQHDISEETTQTSYLGKYRFLAGKHVIAYEEYFQEEGNPPTKSTNLIKITENSVHITKKGTVTTQMHFEPSTIHRDSYQTPFGTFDMMITTEQLTIEDNHKEQTVHIKYSLSLNNSPVSKCTIEIRIKHL